LVQGPKIRRPRSRPDRPYIASSAAGMLVEIDIEAVMPEDEA
jgi:hypothetical protein